MNWRKFSNFSKPLTLIIGCCLDETTMGQAVLHKEAEINQKLRERGIKGEMEDCGFV